MNGGISYTYLHSVALAGCISPPQKAVEYSVLTFLDLLQIFFVKLFLTIDTDRPNSFMFVRNQTKQQRTKQ